MFLLCRRFSKFVMHLDEEKMVRTEYHVSEECVKRTVTVAPHIVLLRNLTLIHTLLIMFDFVFILNPHIS